MTKFPYLKAMLAGLTALTLMTILSPGVSAEKDKGCFDRSRAVTPEEQRISDGEPIPQQILSDSRFDRVVERFEGDLCTAPNGKAAHKLVERHGIHLWKTAVDRAQGQGSEPGELDRYDDRPLYWARLHMTRALRRWDPDFQVGAEERQQLLKRMEYASRGLTATDFPAGRNIKRVLVSGFDPYRLEQEFRRSNPSGASILQMDGQRVRTEDGLAVIRAVMLPVRWRDFEEGIVEDAFGPHLKEGPRRIDLLMTISQGGPRRMAIEGFAGRWHTGIDNETESRSAVIPPVSRWPMPAPLPEFIETTLPYRAMIDADTGPWPVVRNDEVCEWLPPDHNGSPVCHDGGPTPGSKARAGGGGSYLSNESQYRSNRLRLGMGAEDLPGGHLHIAALEAYPKDPSVYINPEFRRERAATVDQTVELVKAAARAVD